MSWLVAFLGHSSCATKCSESNLALRRFLWATDLENGRDECIVLLSACTHTVVGSARRQRSRCSSSVFKKSATRKFLIVTLFFREVMGRGSAPSARRSA